MEPTTAKPTIPTTWPGAFGAFNPSKAIVWFNLKTLLIIFALTVVLGAIPSLFDLDKNLGAQLAVNLLTLAVGIASTVVMLSSLKGKKVSLGAAFKPVASMVFVNLILFCILASLILFGSLLLLIVPFFFVLPRLVMAPILIVDKNLGPIEAIRQSWEMSKGHSGKVWGVVGVTILFALLIVVLVGLYLLFIYQAATVLLYAYLARQSQGSTATNEPAVAAVN